MNRAMQKCIFEHRPTARAQFSLRIAQSDKDFRYPLTELSDTKQCIHGSKCPDEIAHDVSRGT